MVGNESIGKSVESKGFSNLEHKKTLELANALIEHINKKFPDLFSKLEDANFTSVKDLLATKKAFMDGVERESHLIPISDVDNVPYAIHVSFKEYVKESRKHTPENPEEMCVVPVGVINVRVAPLKDVKTYCLATYEVDISTYRYADEDSSLAPSITGTIPEAQNKQTITDESMGLEVSFQVNDPEHVPKHILGLSKIAHSDNLELGDYALRGMNELLETAVKAVKD